MLRSKSAKVAVLCIGLIAAVGLLTGTIYGDPECVNLANGNCASAVSCAELCGNCADKDFVLPSAVNLCVSTYNGYENCSQYSTILCKQTQDCKNGSGDCGIGKKYCTTNEEAEMEPDMRPDRYVSFSGCTS